MNKIISMTLYGNNPIYTNGSIENAKLIPKIFGNEWEIRFYTRHVDPSVIQQLKELNCNVIDMQNNAIKNGRLLRFLAIKENNIVLVRDCDSIVSYREKMMVLEFLNSKKKLHIIRDHPNHKEYIMAGMFAFNNSGIDMTKIIYESRIKDNLHYIMDQVFLAKYIYPLFKGNMLIHDNFNKFYEERDEIVLKYPRVLNHIGQRMIPQNETNLLLQTEDTIRLSHFKGFIKFTKTNFESVYEFINYFMNCLKVSRILKRTLIINNYRIKNNRFKLSDYILIDELLRYTNITTIEILNTVDITISSKELDTNEIKLSLLLKMDNLSNYELLNVDINIIPDQEIDEFTLYNVIQLKDELNYGMEEYIIRKNYDLYTTVICHDNETYIRLESNKDMYIIIKYEELYDDYSSNKIMNEFLRLFSGIFRIHIKPSLIIEKISNRYWNHLDNNFQKI
jgi:hypothetical protein